MKKYLLAALIFISIGAHAQSAADLEGKWMGKLNVGIELRLVFNFELSGDTIYTTLDSPDQGVNGIPTGSTHFENGNLTVDVPLIKGSYKGKYDAVNKKITGIWNQGAPIPLDIVKVDSVEAVKRPQNPVKPYPYKSEDVVFENKKADSVFLAGTITIPQGNGPFPAVVLVTGSGSQNRDEMLMGHSPFLVLSDYLTRHGIIVLRYDDRGYAQSTGDAFTATSEDYASDASAAVNYLASRTDLPISRIGIAGHSEGGMVGPLAATQNKKVAFVVMMAGPGMKGDALLMLQGEKISKAMGMSDSLVKTYSDLRWQIIQATEKEKDPVKLRQALIDINKAFVQKYSDEELRKMGISRSDTLSGVDFYVNPWMRYFLQYDPVPVLKKVSVPVLALNGTNDLQVPCEENLTAVEAALKAGKCPSYNIMRMPGLNHLFQQSVTGSPADYGSIEETFNEKAMEQIATWINAVK